MSHYLRRPFSLAVVLSVVLSTLSVLVPSMAKIVEAAPKTKVKYEVCHRTNAIKNPYRRISVAWSSVNNDNTGHDNPSHDGPVFDVTNPQATHGITPRDSGLGDEAGGGNDRWGDIFNVSRTTGNPNDRTNSKNWTTAGQAIFAGTALNSLTGKPACRAMSVKEFIESQREENPNIPMQEIMDELDEMEAAEDLPLKEVLGGSFGSWFANCTVNCEDVSVITEAIEDKLPKVTTEPPTNVVSTSATLNGTVSPLGSVMQWFFEYVPTTNNFSDDNQAIDITALVNANASTPTSPPQSVSVNLTGLTQNTTYYYRTVGLVTSGSGDTLVESYVYGVVKQFSSASPGSPTITGITCGSQSLSVAFTAPTVNADSIDAYEYSLDGGFSYAAASTQASPISITGLTNGTSYSVVIRANAGAVIGLDSVAVQAVPCGTPSAVTDPPSPVTQANTTLRGTLTGNGNALTVTFIWGTDPQLSTNTTTTNAVPNSLRSTAINYPVTVNIPNLAVNITYYYKVVGSPGSGSDVEGAIEQFVVPSSPQVTTEPATSVTETTATINGTGTSNGASSTVTFTWGTSPTLASGNTTVTAPQSPLSITASSAPVSAALTGLTGGTTYYFRTTIQNVNGTVNGIIRQFTTTTAVTTNDDALGRVVGTAWFDINRNNRRDEGEPLLPGVDVALTPQTVSGQSLSSVRKQSFVMKTTSTGSFDFSQLPPGTYTIKSILPGDFGIQESWDSTGNNDWEVTITVVAKQTSRGDFAAVGTALATGNVDGGADGTFEATWSGFDQTMGNDDDTTFTVKLSGSGGFTLSGLPQGKYSVRATSKSGQVLVSSNALVITKSGAQLSIKGLTMSVRIVAFLPQTGATGFSLPMGFAAMLIPVGAATSALVRRRRR